MLALQVLVHPDRLGRAEVVEAVEARSNVAPRDFARALQTRAEAPHLGTQDLMMLADMLRDARFKVSDVQLRDGNMQLLDSSENKEWSQELVRLLRAGLVEDAAAFMDERGPLHLVGIEFLPPSGPTFVMTRAGRITHSGAAPVLVDPLIDALKHLYAG